MRTILALAVAVTMALGLLAACGKKGLPEPPGPKDQIIFPKSYPTH
jgi:predicted small lipoprotein YifL